MGKWYNVNKVVQTWDGHAEQHKMGKLHPPAGVEIIDEYGKHGQINIDDVRFDEGGHWEGLEDNPSYSQWWVRMEDLSLEPFEPGPVPIPVPEPDPLPVPEPVPSEPSDAELGWALRTIFNALASAFRGPSSSNVN
jgi:hypothetical protein